VVLVRERTIPTIFYSLKFETLSNLKVQFSVVISPSNRVAQLHPEALSSLIPTVVLLIISRHGPRIKHHPTAHMLIRASPGSSTVAFSYWKPLTSNVYYLFACFAAAAQQLMSLQISNRPVKILSSVTESWRAKTPCQETHDCSAVTKSYDRQSVGQSVLVSDSLSSFETPPTWRDRFLYLYPPGTG
jgi:hypothetical protein